VKWPFGHVLGEPFNVAQQRAMLVQAFKALYTIECGGQIIDLPYKWKRENYEAYNDIEYAKKELKAVGQGA
jgi:D-proline reductase (dithiol) PrdB